MASEERASERGVESAARPASVSIVITTCDENPIFLAEAIESATRQTVAAAEIIVVDDGSSFDNRAVLERFPELRVIRQHNQGLAAARNTGWRAAVGDFVVFLDSDDRLIPEALATNLRLFAEHPGCAFVYGAYRFIDREGRATRSGTYCEVGPDAYATFLAGNSVGMHATVMYRRDRLEAVGGFDPSYRACEDYDLYLRLSRRFAVASGSNLIAEYRQHDRNMSNDSPMMLATSLRVLAAQTAALAGNPSWKRARAQGIRGWKEHYAVQQLSKAAATLRARRYRDFPFADLLRVLVAAPLVLPRVGLGGVIELARARAGDGRMDFGALRRTTPISRNFGYDRGKPVDRRYIEEFLASHATDIGGRVLEIGDNSYTLAYGGERVKRSDVLHVKPGAPGATFVGDLTSDDDMLPSDAFECVILTQTLHLLFDLPKAVATLHRILAPGGVLLITTPGVSSVDQGEWNNAWLWSLTTRSLSRLLCEAFGDEAVLVTSYGNVLTAVAFLHGLAADELTEDEYDVADPQYPVIVAARAQKAGYAATAR